jgi:hypothetical protein
MTARACSRASATTSGRTSRPPSAQGVDAPEKPLKKNTHLVECAQFCASHHLSAPRVAPVEAKSDRHAESIDIHRRAKRQLLAGRFATTDHSLGSMNV